ncbi:MAG: AMP-binding protein, partial [Nannocystaceae bacterium]|nr:AMP-binding protein [Nannocystaceae bacterium]
PGKVASGAGAQRFPAALPTEPAPLVSPSPDPDPDPDIEALVLSTSGSTGQPSLIPISQRNLGAQAETMGRQLGIGAGDAVLNVSPLNHVDGVTGLFMAWWTRSTLVRVPFQIHALHEFTDAVWRYDVTHAVVVPTVLSLLLRLAEDVREAFAAERFRLVVCTAAPLSEEIWRNFEQATGRPVVNMYGLTECGNVLFAGPDEASRVPGTVGRPVDCELALLDESGAPSAAGDQGMIWISGASVATRAPGVVQRDGQSWFPTGDLARRGEDGLVRIVGRKRNVIITGGRNIFPQEIDAALMAHPDVLESATLGMADSVWGEQAQSVVVVRGDEVDEAALAAHVAERLADWKVPRRVHVWPALPKGKTGKVDRMAVRRQLTESAGSDSGTASRDMAAVESEVLSLASQSFRVPREAVTVAARAGEFRGWDSLAHLTFVVALEKAFGLDFDPSEVVAIETLAQAVTAVLGKLEAQGR